MNNTVRQAIIFVSGALIGSGITFLSVKGHYKRLYDKKAEEQRESFKKRLSEFYSTSSSKAKEAINKPDIRDYDSEEKQEKELKFNSFSEDKLINDKYLKAPYKDYSKYFVKSDEKDTEKNKEETDSLESTDSNDSSADIVEEDAKNYLDIYPIEYGEYVSSNGYDKIAITSYLHDVYADELENEMDNYAEFLGDNPKQFFNSDLAEGDSVYLHNNIMNVDIELIRSNKTYEEAKEDYI